MAPFCIARIAGFTASLDLQPTAFSTVVVGLFIWPDQLREFRISI